MNKFDKIVAVKSLVSQDGLHRFPVLVAEQTVLHQQLSLGDLMALSRRQRKRDGVAQGISHYMHFCGEPSLAAAKRLGLGITFFWPAAC